jgi:hypothetical protein
LETAFNAYGTELAYFGSTVRGSSEQRGTQLAVAFTAREDKPLTGSLISFGHS